MAIRFRNATPGTLLCLAATILLALVSFNTPLLKSLNFLSATYSSGTYEGSLNLGTLGFCHTLSGATNCTGPQVGYEFDPNDVFGVTLFDIPEVITKYLTYVLILHVVAFAFAALATLVGLLAHSPTFPMVCLSIWLAGLASSVSFIASVFDLAMFYIARTRIDDVSGASATIGTCVWLTIAAFVILAVSGCFFSIGGCCGACRARDESGDARTRSKYDRDNGEDDYKMRMMAVENERARKQEQGLPSFQELTPLKDDGDDKYLYENQQQQQQQQVMPGGLRRDGSVLQGVGVGYGRRNNRTPANDYATGQGQAGYPGGWDQHQPQGYGNQYQDIALPPPVARRGSDVTSAGEFAGVGAGGAGVERPQPQGYGAQGYYPNEHQYNEASQAYYDNQDPYNQQQSNDPYNQGQSSYSDPYRSHTAQPYDSSRTPDPYGAAPLAMPTPAPAAGGSRGMSQGQGYDTFSGAASTESHDPGPRVNYADNTNPNPYDGYDDGLGAIGMAATSGGGRHERDYTGQTFGYNDTQIQSGGGYDYSSERNNSGGGIAEPRPQHLVNPNTSNLLRSPVSPVTEIGYQRDDIVGQSGGGGTGGYGYDHDTLNVGASGSARPPSYSAGNYTSAPGPEKSSYR